MMDYHFNNWMVETHLHMPIHYYEQVCMHLLNLRGARLDYYGADEAECEFKVDEIAFKVIADPEDGYRSHLGVMDYSDASKSIFFSKPVAKVRVEDFDNVGRSEEWGTQRMRGYRLVDWEDGHVWLEFGTDYTEDYYPRFIFRHQPKEPAKNYR